MYSYHVCQSNSSKLEEFFKDVRQITPKSKPFIISSKATLFEAIQEFAKNGQERFVIVGRETACTEQTGPEDSVVGIITQNDILRLIVQNIPVMRKEKIFGQTLKNLDIGTRRPNIVPCKETVANIISNMGTSRCEGFAIVDENGKFFSDFSSKDLKYLSKRNSFLLGHSVDQYLIRDRSRRWWVRPPTTSLDESLFTLVLQLVCSKVHRIYIVDSNGAPIGEINHNDVLKELVKI